VTVSVHTTLVLHTIRHDWPRDARDLLCWDAWW
jgi:hypothetical protein